MAFTENFSVAQNPLIPSTIVITDTSSGADAAITQRRVFVQDAYGNYLVPVNTTTNYTPWSIIDISISLDILTQNTATSITVQWLDVNNSVLYTSTNQYAFAEYGKQFLYYLVQLQGLTPTIPADTNYNTNVAILWTAILGGLNAISINSDVAASQNSLNRATYMQLNQSLFF